MELSRRTLLTTSLTVAPFLMIAGCASVQTNLNKQTPLGAAAATITAGVVALELLNNLVETGVLPAHNAKTFAKEVNAVGAVYAALKANVDQGMTVSQLLLDEAAVALNALQNDIAPAAKKATPAQLERLKATRPKLVISIAVVLSWILANLPTLMAAGQDIASLVKQIASELSSGGSATTAADVDNAWAAWASQVITFQSLTLLP